MTSGTGFNTTTMWRKLVNLTLLLFGSGKVLSLTDYPSTAGGHPAGLGASDGIILNA
jgi:hypothetical protein